MRKFFNRHVLLAQTTGCCDLLNTQEETVKNSHAQKASDDVSA